MATRLPNLYRNFIFTLLGISWVSGTIFFILSRWFVIEGEFGPEKHPFQQPVLMIHGAAAFLMMVTYGAMLMTHVPSGWRLNRLRGLGLTLVSVIGFQIISAYLLYYLANEDIRDIVANLHALTGFLLPLVLTVHILVGHNTRPRYQQNQTKAYES